MGVPSKEPKKVWIRIWIEYDLKTRIYGGENAINDQGTYKSSVEGHHHQAMDINVQSGRH